MHFDSINEALIACVKAAGGSKTVGGALWPDIAPDQAQRKLLNALDESRPENLKPADVAEDLMRQVIESQRLLALQMERLASLQPQLRAVA